MSFHNKVEQITGYEEQKSENEKKVFIENLDNPGGVEGGLLNSPYYDRRVVTNQ